MEEHHIAEVSMVELDKMSKQEEFWAAKLSVFQELINHHIQEEESKIFEDAQKAISEEQIQKVMTNFQEEKEQVKSKAMASQSQR
jgi:hemerythrin-like domain-containing protein